MRKILGNFHIMHGERSFIKIVTESGGGGDQHTVAIMTPAAAVIFGHNLANYASSWIMAGDACVEDDLTIAAQVEEEKVRDLLIQYPALDEIGRKPKEKT